MDKTIYALDKQVVNDIESKMKALLELCQKYQVPMFSAVAISNSETETIYNNIVYNAKSHNINLTDDKIRKHMLIANGFNAVPARESIEINPMDFISDE